MRTSECVKTSCRITPMVYAYTTPEIHRHDGWVKIGYTEQPDVLKRVEQQTHTADVRYHLEWNSVAIFDDNGERFTDKDFHRFLRKNHVPQQEGKDNEWFQITPGHAKDLYLKFKANHGIIKNAGVVPYRLRDEQERAVTQTIAYMNDHPGKEFLWNAKPRFGKTLAVYDLCKRISARNVLILTNRPAIANSWYGDHAKFVGPENGYWFVSTVDGVQNNLLVHNRKQYVDELCKYQDGQGPGCFEFISLQDLKGSIYFGGSFKKLREVAEMTWDLLVIDEAHEGVDTYKTDVAFDHIKRKFTLHLSGTPFKALANDKFPEDAIYNWTYADEQEAKRRNAGNPDSPYASLPRLNLFTYRMSEIIKGELQHGVEIDGETEEYAFDLNEFFETKMENGTPVFVHEDSVDKFLDALVHNEKYPFSTEALRKELKHTLWLLNRVDSAKALARKLEANDSFAGYKVVLAAGDGRLDDADEQQKAFNRVREAIAGNDKTITLSVGQLTTGVTIPEWTAVLMLSNLKSPALYMQAAFRAQNPWKYSNGTAFCRKENAYVFDFDPARTLTIYEEFANDLSSDTAAGRGDMDARKQHVRKLLNFFPVIGEDDEGKMEELDAEKVLSIPRKIRSEEVVRRGFMSNYLFQNISNVFHAPKEVIDIITSFPAVKDTHPVDPTPTMGQELGIGEDGDIHLASDEMRSKTEGLFGDKIYGKEDADEDLAKVEEDLKKSEKDDQEDKSIETLKKTLHTAVTVPIIRTAQQKYAGRMTGKVAKRIERQLKAEGDFAVERAVGDYRIQKKVIDDDCKQVLKDFEQGKREYKNRQDIQDTFDRRRQEAKEDLYATIDSAVKQFRESAAQKVVETVEKADRERKRDEVEDSVKSRLKGFARTIPSFLMAYGTGEQPMTLMNFDTIVEDNVFKEVTGITISQFKFLRDGGTYTDEAGNTKEFKGNLFDPVVFDDSVKEFMRLEKELANYFDDDAEEDIFDYIPPQRTNQIFTPKRVVKTMVDMLEKENPGCFDNPDKTFADLYMKSGLYIAEIVRRLYRSNRMKELFPDDKQRLRHIFEKQVYGMAPTRIIYLIATHYILGFDPSLAHVAHFVQADASKAAKEHALKQLVEEKFA